MNENHPTIEYFQRSTDMLTTTTLTLRLIRHIYSFHINTKLHACEERARSLSLWKSLIGFHMAHQTHHHDDRVAFGAAKYIVTFSWRITSVSNIDQKFKFSLCLFKTSRLVNVC